MMSVRLVYDRARRIAASTASAPPLKNCVRVRSPGASSAMSCTSSARAREVKLPTVTALELRGQRRDVARVRVAEAGDRHAGVQIEVGVAVEIGQRRSAAVLDGQLGEQRDRLQAGRDVLLFFVKQRLVRARDETWVPGSMHTPREIFGNRVGRRLTARRERRPVVEIDQRQVSRRRHDDVAAEDVESRRPPPRARRARSSAAASNGVAARLARVEPVEEPPAARRRRT